MTIRLFVTCVAIAILLSPALARAQSRVFADDFEAGLSPGWTGTAACPVVTAAPDGGPPFQGTHQASCNWDGVACTHDMELALDPFPGSNQMLIRYWVRIDRDMDFRAGSKLGRIGFQGPNEVIWTVQLEQGRRSTLYVSIESGAVFWGSGRAVLGDHAWHKIEFFIRRGAKGLLRAWVDDRLVWSSNGSMQTLFNLYLHSNWSCNAGWEHDANNHELIDGVEVFSDSSVGTAIVSGTLENGDATVAESGRFPAHGPSRQQLHSRSAGQLRR